MHDMGKAKIQKIRFKNTDFLERAMFGLIAGDALGVPFEFKQRDTFEVNDMIGFGTHHQPAGTWSDDTSMTLATLESFIECEYFDYEDLMNRFSRWLHQGDYCPYGKCFDAGHATIAAIGRYEEGRSPLLCGGRGFRDNGNGSLMRILPIVFVEHTVDDILNLSSLTHAHEISLMCCRLYVQLAENLIKGMDKGQAIKHLTCCVDECADIPKMDVLPRERIRSTGYVADTFEAAVWCLMNTENYRDCVIEAVKLGNDTDTVAAAAGGLAGIYYGIGGEKGIPEEWINLLARKDWISEMIQKAVKKQSL